MHQGILALECQNQLDDLRRRRWAPSSLPGHRALPRTLPELRRPALDRSRRGRQTVLLERPVASGDQVRPHLDGPRPQRHASPLATTSGDLRGQGVQLDLEREVLAVEPYRVRRDAGARQSAQAIHDADEQVVEGELQRPEDELCHGSAVSLSGGAATSDRRFCPVFELFGSTPRAWHVRCQRGLSESQSSCSIDQK